MSSHLQPDVELLYRLPWTDTDNAMTWLEPTRKCNITCDACFVENNQLSQKSLQQIQSELDTMLRLRRCDAMLIAGGEPLTHPQISEIVQIVRRSGVKPILITNGVGLDRTFLCELKQAGAYGFTFHVDSHQSRPGWIGKNEKELNELRGQLADMLHEVGGLTCAFNTTIFPDTLQHVPDIVEWAVHLPDKVQILTLICVRLVNLDDPYIYYVGNKLVDFSKTPYVTSAHYRNLTAQDIYRQIKEVLPHFKFCAFLGGTVNPQSLKWVIGCQISSTKRTYGNIGPRSMEILQNVYHALRNRYLSYTRPRTSSRGKFTLLLSLFDSELRKTALSFLAEAFRNPSVILKPLYVQNISVVQPVDILPTGEQDRCNGCPNGTLWKDRLVPACRLEEYIKFGGPVHTIPKQKN